MFLFLKGISERSFLIGEGNEDRVRSVRLPFEIAGTGAVVLG